MRPFSKTPALIIGKIFILSVAMISCQEKQQASSSIDTGKEEKVIAAMLDSFNRAAARADFDRYFGFYTDDAIFAGTDATERWDMKAFKVWAKPFFDRGRAWDFTAIERHVYLDATGNTGWFDELLNTQMKICRGSGVVVKKGDEWKVQQYILSTTVPNALLDTVISMKAPAEGLIIDSLQKKK